MSHNFKIVRAQPESVLVASKWLEILSAKALAIVAFLECNQNATPSHVMKRFNLTNDQWLDVLKELESHGIIKNFEDPETGLFGQEFNQWI